MSISLTEQSELLQPLREKFNGLRARLQRWFVIDGLRHVFWWLLVLVAIDFVIDWSFELDGPQRLVMLLLAVLAIGWVAMGRLIMPLLQSPTDDALCYRIQHKHRLGDSLINAMQLSRVDDAERLGISPAMIRESIRDGLAATSDLEFDDVLDSRVYRRNLLAVALAGALLAGLGCAVVTADTMSLWFARNVMLSDQQWPKYTHLQISDVRGGKIQVPRGADWPITILVGPNSRKIPKEVTLEFESERVSRAETLLPTSNPIQFSTTLKQVVHPLRIRARAGRVVTAWIDVQPIDYPTVARLELYAIPPKYTGQSRRQLSPDKSQEPVLEGSLMQVTGRSSKPLTSARLFKLNEATELEVATFTIDTADGTGFRADFPVMNGDAGTYFLELVDTEQIVRSATSQGEHLVNRRAARFNVRVQADKPPRVQLRRGKIGSMVTAEAIIPFAVEVRERYGLTDMNVIRRWRQPDEGNEPATKIHKRSLRELAVGWEDGQLLIEDRVDMADAPPPVGAEIEIMVDATDNNDVSGPNTSISAPLRFRVVASEELRAELLHREHVARQMLETQHKHHVGVMAQTRDLLSHLENRDPFAQTEITQLARIYKAHKQFTGQVASINEGLQRILSEIQYNRLEDSGGSHQQRLKQHVVVPLQQLVDEGGPMIQRQLDAARRTVQQPKNMETALAAAVSQQRQVDRQLRDAIEHMVQDVNFQLVMEVLREISASQEQLLKDAEDERQRLIRQFLESEGKTGNRPGADGD